METKILLSGDYLYRVAPWLTWSEILYGLNHSFINDKGVVDYAFLKLDERSSSDEIELASLSGSELYQVVDILTKLASDAIGKNIFLESWLYLFLSWIYDHRDSFSDPFGAIEELYADFDYPEDVATIVRYQLLPEGEVGGDEYLYNNWQRLISLYKQRLKSCI